MVVGWTKFKRNREKNLKGIVKKKMERGQQRGK